MDARRTNRTKLNRKLLTFVIWLICLQAWTKGSNFCQANIWFICLQACVSQVLLPSRLHQRNLVRLEGFCDEENLEVSSCLQSSICNPISFWTRLWINACCRYWCMSTCAMETFTITSSVSCGHNLYRCCENLYQCGLPRILMELLV